MFKEFKAYMTSGTVLGRMTTLAELASAAAFAASDRATAISGAILNATCGSVMDADRPPTNRRSARDFHCNDKYTLPCCL
jgi:enoyl-[acyl-carrier-protein] reductase (NADH)